MIPTQASTVADAQGKPRASGDDPAKLATQESLKA